MANLSVFVIWSKKNTFSSICNKIHEAKFKGQTLIETLASLAIISIVITAIGVVVTTSLNEAKYDQFLTLATKYAQQGIEIVQQIRDDSYTGFTAYNGIYCVAKGQTTLGNAQANGCTTPNVDNFIRSITIRPSGCGFNVSIITVSVSFTDAKCHTGIYCHTAVDNTCLSTINPIHAP